jgi:CMP-N-acetylneuraminic acid synthetase
MRIVALIPARAGSKGIANKNLSLIGSKSLIELKIENALDVAIFDEIFVSSDSDEIIEIAQKLDVNPVKRPLDISGDTSNANQVVDHLLSFCLKDSSPDDILVYLQPTSPFTRKNTISEMVRLCANRGLPVVAVRGVKEHPAKMLSLGPESKISLYNKDGSPTQNRQDLEKLFIATGGCYVFRIRDFRKLGEVPVESAIAFLVDETEGFDIDLPIDLLVAQELDMRLNE